MGVQTHPESHVVVLSPGAAHLPCAPATARADVPFADGPHAVRLPSSPGQGWKQWEGDKGGPKKKIENISVLFFVDKRQ